VSHTIVLSLRLWRSTELNTCAFTQPVTALSAGFVAQEEQEIVVLTSLVPPLIDASSNHTHSFFDVCSYSLTWSFDLWAFLPIDDLLPWFDENVGFFVRTHILHPLSSFYSHAQKSLQDDKVLLLQLFIPLLTKCFLLFHRFRSHKAEACLCFDILKALYFLARAAWVIMLAEDHHTFDLGRQRIRLVWRSLLQSADAFLVDLCCRCRAIAVCLLVAKGCEHGQGIFQDICLLAWIALVLLWLHRKVVMPFFKLCEQCFRDLVAWCRDLVAWCRDFFKLCEQRRRDLVAWCRDFWAARHANTSAVANNVSVVVTQSLSSEEIVRRKFEQAAANGDMICID